MIFNSNTGLFLVLFFLLKEHLFLLFKPSLCFKNMSIVMLVGNSEDELGIPV